MTHIYGVHMNRPVAPLLLLPRGLFLASVAPILICLSACSTTHVVGRPLTADTVQHLRLEALNNPVTVDYAASGTTKVSPGTSPRPQPVESEQIRSARTVLAGVSLDWLTFGTAKDGYQRIASSRVRRISVSDHGRSAIDGLFYGLLSGVAAGVLVGAIAASGGCRQTSNGYFTTTKCPSKWSSMMGFGILGGLGGSLVGVLTGAAVGYRTTFVF